MLASTRNVKEILKIFSLDEIMKIYLVVSERTHLLNYGGLP